MTCYSIIYIYIYYIYIYIERERDMCIYIYIERDIHVYIYIYMYTYTYLLLHESEPSRSLTRGISCSPSSLRCIFPYLHYIYSFLFFPAIHASSQCIGLTCAFRIVDVAGVLEGQALPTIISIIRSTIYQRPIFTIYIYIYIFVCLFVPPLFITV